jgi:hypothetical protein
MRRHSRGAKPAPPSTDELKTLLARQCKDEEEEQLNERVKDSQVIVLGEPTLRPEQNAALSRTDSCCMYSMYLCEII